MFASTLYPVFQLSDNKSTGSEDATSLYALDNCKAAEPNSYLQLDKESWLFETVAIGDGRDRSEESAWWPSRVGEDGLSRRE